MSQSPGSIDELEFRARRQLKREALPIRDVGPKRLADLPETDYSDQRRYWTGIDSIDISLGPTLVPGGFSVIFGRSGRGKTILGEQIAVANAPNYQVAYCALEMTEERHRDSIIARELGLSSFDYARAADEGSADFLRRRTAVMDRLESLYLWKPKDRSVAGILRDAEKVHADLLIVDYARYVGGWRPGQVASDITEQFSVEAKKSKRHIMVLSQLHLEQSMKRPTEADVEDTKRLYHEAEVAMFIHRPFYGKASQDNLAEVLVLKNRDGPPFCGHVHFGGALRTLFSMSAEEDQQARCCHKQEKPRPRSNAPRSPLVETRAEEDALLESDIPF
jgi:replicative DNA helicase